MGYSKTEKEVAIVAELVFEFYAKAPMSSYGNACTIQASDRRYAIGTISTCQDCATGFDLRSVRIWTKPAPWPQVQDAIMGILADTKAVKQ